MPNRLVHRDVWVFLCVVLLWAWIAAPWLGGEVTIPYDAKAHFQAQIQFLANALHRGDSPFWTPNIFGGSPQIADPQSLIFSPAILLALFDKAPSFRTMDTYVLGLLLAGGLAVVQFGRERGWHPAAQIVAALVLAFGASASWRLQHVGQVQSVACFAVAFWLLARSLRLGSWRSGLGAGIAAGLMVVKPDQVAFLGAYILAAYAAWFLLKDGAPWKALRRALPALGTAAVAGLLIVAVPLVMTVLFSENSNRAEIDIIEAGRGSLHPASLLTAFVGDLYGAKDPNVDYWGPSSSAWSPGGLTLSQNMGQLYIGALPLLAVIFCLAGGWRQLDREARFVVCALAVAVVYALGFYTPLFPLTFRWLPGADLFRRPADATFMVGALMAFLSGFALNDALTPPASQRTRRRILVTLLVAVVAVGMSAGVALWHQQAMLAWPAIATGVLWMVVCLAGLVVVQRHGTNASSATWQRTATVCACLAVLVSLDLKLNNGPNESTGLPPAQYAVMDPETDNHTVGYLKALLARGQREPARRDRVELLGMDFHWPNIGMIHGFDHAFGYNPLHLADYTEATGARDHMGGAKDRTFTTMFPSYRSTFADILGLRYVVSSVPVEQIDKRLVPGDLVLLNRTRDAFIYENRAALPRAMFVASWELADFDALRETGYPAGFDPKKTLLLQAVPDAVVMATKGKVEAKVSIKSYANTEVIIEVEAAQAGFVVLNDVWHPWWSATVNGEDVDILKANVLFRAVAVEAGKSTIRFTFNPLEGAIAELRDRVMGTEDELPTHVAMIP